MGSNGDFLVIWRFSIFRDTYRMKIDVLSKSLSLFNRALKLTTRRLTVTQIEDHQGSERERISGKTLNLNVQQTAHLGPPCTG